MTKLKLVLCVVVVGALLSPAVADVTYTPMTGGGNQIGIVQNGELNSVYVDPGAMSDTFTFTFGIHVSSDYNVPKLDFSFIYDNSSIEVLHMETVSEFFPWAAEYHSKTAGWWPNTSVGIQAVAGLTQTQTLYTVYNSTDINPFMRVQLHVKSATSSQENEFGLVLNATTGSGALLNPGYGAGDGYGLTLFSTLSSYNITRGQWDYAGGIIHEIPEPSSLLLLGGVATGLLGYVRRRR